MSKPYQRRESPDVLRTFIIAFLVAVMLAAIGVGAAALSGRQADAQAQSAARDLYEGVPFDEHLLRLDKQALEEAYHQQLLKLFSVWLVSGAPKDAAQFQNGLKIARRAYAQAAQQIEKREQELQRPR